MLSPGREGGACGASDRRRYIVLRPAILLMIRAREGKRAQCRQIAGLLFVIPRRVANHAVALSRRREKSLIVPFYPRTLDYTGTASFLVVPWVVTVLLIRYRQIANATNKRSTMTNVAT
jgi:hypothetical protein